MISRISPTLAIIAALAVSGAPALSAADPSTKQDGSWITISGTAVATNADSFTLDYGKGTVQVQMDDWDLDWYKEGYAKMDGHEVTVSGRIDDNFFVKNSIEASSVYDWSLNQYFYPNSTDAQASYWNYSQPVYNSGQTTVYGTVTKTSPDDRAFTVDTGSRTLKVDTNEMLYNPLDQIGFQKIEIGDRVSVTGDMNTTFFLNRELEANSVITMYDASLYGKNNTNKKK